MRKYLFFFLILIILLFPICFLISENTLRVSIISKLVCIKGKLGKLYIQRLFFELADDNEQILKGAEKYVLRAHDGSKWLFKPCFPADEIRTMIAYKLANLLGVDTPEMYKLNISINGITIPGFLQRIVPSNSQSFVLDEFIEQKRYNFNSSIFKNEIFSWLLSFSYNAIEMIIDPSGVIYQIDLTEALYGGTEVVPYSKTGEYPLKLFEMEDINVDFGQVYAFLKYIDGIDNDWLIKYLKTILNKYKSPAYLDNMADLLIERDKTTVEKCIKYFSLQSKFHNKDVFRNDSFLYRINICKKSYRDFLLTRIDNIENMIRKRKRTLFEYFCKRYSLHPNFQNEDLDRANIFLYQIVLCKKLCRDILQKCIYLLSLEKKRSINELIEISSISSGLAWDYLLTFLLNPLNLSDFKNAEVQKRFLDAENKLIFMRQDCNDFREKLAIVLYLRQVRMLKEYINKYQYFDSTMFVPIVQNVHTFRHPSSTDRWFSLVSYQNKENISIVKLKGEDEYIMGLLKLIKKQYDEAVQFFLAAQKKGYAVVEIKDIIKNMPTPSDLWN